MLACHIPMTARFRRYIIWCPTQNRIKTPCSSEPREDFGQSWGAYYETRCSLGRPCAGGRGAHIGQPVEDEIAAVAEVFRLFDYEELKRAEQKYLIVDR